MIAGLVDVARSAALSSALFSRPGKRSRVAALPGLSGRAALMAHSSFSRRPVALASRSSWIVLGVLGGALSACGVAEKKSPEASTFVNTALNLSVQNLDNFDLVRSDENEIRFAGPGGESELWVTVSPRTDFGIVLERVVAEEKTDYESRAGAHYSGATRLILPAGPGYSIRGRYDKPGESGAQIEELRVVFVHPAENRLVRGHYSYPAGDDQASRERVTQLLEWLAEVNAAPAPSPE